MNSDVESLCNGMLLCSVSAWQFGRGVIGALLGFVCLWSVGRVLG